MTIGNFFSLPKRVNHEYRGELINRSSSLSEPRCVLKNEWILCKSVNFPSVAVNEDLIVPNPYSGIEVLAASRCIG